MAAPADWDTLNSCFSLTLNCRPQPDGLTEHSVTSGYGCEQYKLCYPENKTSVTLKSQATTWEMILATHTSNKESTPRIKNSYKWRSVLGVHWKD